MGIALQRLFPKHEDPAFLERQQARCCSSSFSTSKVHYWWNSSSTEEPLRLMCTVRHSKAYTGPSRTKDRSCSRKVWFCSMITHIHTCPASQTRSGQKCKCEQLDHLSYRPDMSSCDFHEFGLPKNI